MALDPSTRRQDGVSSLSESDLQGSRGGDGRGVNLPVTTYRNPGPTENLRGIEPNTALAGSSNLGDPVIEATPEVPISEPFQMPDSSGLNAVGPGDPSWGTADSSARNSHALDVPPDAFDALGERYPANGGLRDRT